MDSPTYLASNNIIIRNPRTRCKYSGIPDYNATRALYHAIKNQTVYNPVDKVYIQQKLNYVKLKIKPLNKEWLFYTYFSNCG